MACRGFPIFDETINLRISETLITCQICMNTFESPRILPCQHTFCKECVAAIIEKNCLDAGGKVKKSTFPCPSCRRDCKIRTKENSLLDDHLKCFPESLLLKQILESVGNKCNKIPDVETRDKETQSEDRVYPREGLQDHAKRQEKSSERSMKCYGMFLSILLSFIPKLNQEYSLSNSLAFQYVLRGELIDFAQRLYQIPFASNFRFLDITALESSLRIRCRRFGKIVRQNNDQTATQEAEVKTEHLRSCSPLTCHGFEIIGICLLRLVIFLETYCFCYPFDFILRLVFRKSNCPMEITVMIILCTTARHSNSAIYLVFCKAVDVAMTIYFSHFSFLKAALVFIGLFFLHLGCMLKMKSFPEITFILNKNKHLFLLSILSSLSFIQNMYRFARLSDFILIQIIAVIHFDFQIGVFGFLFVIELLQFVVIKALFCFPLLIDKFFWERHICTNNDIQAHQEREMFQSILNRPMLVFHTCYSLPDHGFSSQM